MTTWRWDPAWEQELVATTRVADALDKGADIVERGAVRRAPVSEDGSGLHPPGQLKASIGTTAGRDADGPYRDVGSDLDYSLYVETGTAPHVIRAHGEYPLRNPHTGQVFGREVHHPGTDPQPYLRPALDDLAGRTL